MRSHRPAMVTLALMCITAAQSGYSQTPAPVSPYYPSSRTVEVAFEAPAEPAPDDNAPNDAPSTAPPTGPCEYVFGECVRPRSRWAPDTFQLLTGYYITSTLGPDIPKYDYIPLTTRLGWYLTKPCAPGAFELLLDSTFGAVTTGFGNYFTGPSLLLRYERGPMRRVVPYIQAGAGVVLNDGYKDRTQRAIGQSVEFYLQAALGVRYRITPECSFDLEGGFQHISNAGIAPRNAGINNFGATAGFTWTWGDRAKGR